MISIIFYPTERLSVFVYLGNIVLLAMAAHLSVLFNRPHACYFFPTGDGPTTLALPRLPRYL